MMKKHTKIVGTIGPASESVETLIQLIHAGMNVARLNFSHGNHQEHLNRILSIREASKQTNMPVAIMLDTKGPEIRVGMIENNKILLSVDENIILTIDSVIGKIGRASCRERVLRLV